MFSVVRVEDDMNVKGYSQFCCNLLKVYISSFSSCSSSHHPQDDTLMYITVKSSTAKHVDKTMKVAEKVNKNYRKVAKKDSADLHQYVSWDFPAAEDDKKGKKKSKKGTPLAGVIVHLSKKAMPELEPKLSTPSVEDVPSAASSPAICEWYGGREAEGLLTGSYSDALASGRTWSLCFRASTYASSEGGVEEGEEQEG